ncbi:MAG: hypothetical protein VKJ64_20580 [Leptolyngbyaceae bacterium]|nr:hypothetical protein [Leptolyngbyaceae bacterium]
MLSRFSFNSLAASLLSIPIAIASSSAVLAAKQGFQVQNNTSVDLHYLYVSESSLDNWGDDVLGAQEVLPPGNYIDIIFNNPDPNVCIYDFRGEFADGDVVEEWQFNVCQNEAFQFYEY